MTIINREAVIPYSPHQMFDLVNRIEDYPHFVPWCKSVEVISRTEDEIQAKLDFARGGLQKSFTTCNRLQENKMIEIRLINGPFQHLEGFWRFEPLSDGSRIRLDLEFEFSNKLMGMMFSPVFHPVADTLVEVFCKRAHEVYGAA
jgi:ribosome-associated toxin RatA of RatAB toxin-antitoxin module